jgi:glycine cleavage system H protein
MSELPGDLLYTRQHEWLRREEDGNMTIGVTDHAQSALGDLVYVELPEVGQDVESGGDMAVVESVKAASDVYAPKINVEPYGEGWIVKLQPSGDVDEGALLTPDAYQILLDEEEA